MRVATIVYYNTALVYYILYIWEVDAHTYYLRTYTHTLAHAHGSNKFDFRCYPTDNNNFTKYILPKNVPLFRFPRVFHHWLLQSAESRAYTVKSSTRRRRCVRVQATIRWRDDIRSDPPQPAADQLYNIKLYSIHTPRRGIDEVASLTPRRDTNRDIPDIIKIYTSYFVGL